MYCETCKDSQIIRLPLHKRLPAAFFAGLPDTVESLSYKEYPCPECTPLVPKDKVRIVECHSEADIRYEGDENYRQHVVDSAIHQLAHEIEKHGFARIQTIKPDVPYLKRKYRISVAVAAPQIADEIDAERFVAEEAFAALVVQIAAQNIDLWGSYYSYPDITKRDAKRILNEAIAKARKTRPKALR